MGIQELYLPLLVRLSFPGCKHWCPMLQFGSKHCHEMTGFLLWDGTYYISCVVQQRSRVNDLFSLVGYDDSCLAAIRHVKSIMCVIQLRPNIGSHSVLLLCQLASSNFIPKRYCFY